MFVQTDNTAGNQVVAYQRSDDGTLALAGTYNTGGVGGVLNGSAVDPLASQGSLTYDPHNSLLYAVNAGSNSVSVFSVQGDHLSLRQVIGSGGTFPVSVAVRNGLVYVLNAESGACRASSPSSDVSTHCRGRTGTLASPFRPTPPSSPIRPPSGLFARWLAADRDHQGQRK